MKKSSRLSVAVLVSLTLLSAASGIVSDVAATQLPAYFESLRPLVWPVFGLLAVATVVLVLVQVELENRADGEPAPETVHTADSPSEPDPGPHHNLPNPDYSIFIGREKELAQVQRILRPYPHSQEHLITVDGVGGVGKSALALEVAHRYLRDYHHLPQEERFEAIIWTSAKATALTANGIAPRHQITRTLDDIYTAISIVLEHKDITQSLAEERDGLVARALTKQRTLLIVDNLETVDDERVTAFLRQLPAPTKAIITTRHRIDVAYPLRLTGMPQEEAQELIATECRRKGAKLTPPQMQKLYDRTGGVPLALVWSIAQIGYGHNADDVLRRLGNPSGDIARFCFEGTVERIKDKSILQILLAQAVFATDASREALGYVAELGEDVLSRDEALVELEKLSLVNKKDGRFSLLPLTKTYVNTLAPNIQALRLRQAEFYLTFFDELDGQYGKTADKWKSYPSIDLERQNLIDLLDWCLQNQKWQELIDLQNRLWEYWEARGYWFEMERWCQHALEACSQLAADSPVSQANLKKKGECHLALCWVRLNQDRFKEACSEANQAIEILTPIENWHNIAIAHRRLGLIRKLEGEVEQNKENSDSAEELFKQAQEHYETARDIWQRLDDQREVSSVLANMGHMLIAQGKYLEARGYLEQALTIRRESKDISRISTTLRGLGQLDELEGKFESAAQRYQEALNIARQVDDKISAGRAALDLAELEYRLGNSQEAGRLAISARELFESLNLTAFVQRDVKQARKLLKQVNMVGKPFWNSSSTFCLC